jgi:hypothetical protein
MKETKPKAFWNLFSDLVKLDKTTKLSPVPADD